MSVFAQNYRICKINELLLINICNTKYLYYLYIIRNKQNENDMSTTIEKINGVTAEIKKSENAPAHFPKYSSIKKMIEYMTENDIIYKFANINGEKVTIKLSKSEKSIENSYNNAMRIGKNNHELPENIWN